MKSFNLVAPVLACSILLAAPNPNPSTDSFFPYAVEKVTLDNGLDILIIEMPEFKDVLSYNTMVLAGGRSETEKGKTGFAHLFEHIMFQHSYKGEPDGYRAAINSLGAHNNGWTWYDITYYHPLTFTSKLGPQSDGMGAMGPGLLELEASRFMDLDYDEAIFKRETGAVMGEYRNNASNPGGALNEKRLGLMFPNHSYGHRVIGTYDDIVDMPQQYEYSKWFYDTYYRPNNCVIVVAGDIRKDEVVPLLREAFSAWEYQEVPPIDVADPPQTEEYRGEVEWDAAVPPRISVAHKGPKYVTGSKASAVGQIISELVTSNSAPLYKKLRFDKGTASSLGMSGPDSFDRYVINLSARLYSDQYKERGAEYLKSVEADMVAGLDDLKSFASSPDAGHVLDMVKSKFKYDFLAELNSPAHVAQQLAWFYRFERDPNVIDKLMASVQALTPVDIENFAKEYFVASNRTVVTLTPKEGA